MGILTGSGCAPLLLPSDPECLRKGSDQNMLVNATTCLPMDTREFNIIQWPPVDGLIIKRGHIEGEAFYYDHLTEIHEDSHEEFKAFFPACTTKRALGRTLELHIEHVPGSTFSRRIAAGVGSGTEQLRVDHFVLLLDALNRIHNTEPPSSFAQIRQPAHVIHSNYTEKLRRRFTENAALYKSLGEDLGIDTLAAYQSVCMFFQGTDGYSDLANGVCGRACPAWYIHGDPVFSNVLLAADRKAIRLIDMRGQLGDGDSAIFTTQGDAAYDLSKVYQSLLGYDLMVLDFWPPSEQQLAGLARLRTVFWDFVGRWYPSVSPRDVRMLAAQHFFSIPPLHKDSPHRQRWYMQVACQIMREELRVGSL